MLNHQCRRTDTPAEQKISCEYFGHRMALLVYARLKRFASLFDNHELARLGGRIDELAGECGDLLKLVCGKFGEAAPIGTPPDKEHVANLS
jgi:hypothetical protein